jgi:hypothetical protein
MLKEPCLDDIVAEIEYVEEDDLWSLYYTPDYEEESVD